jgi:hypothetical protein
VLISLLVAVLVAGLIWYLLSLLPIPEPFRKVVLIIFILICVIYLLGYVGFGGGPYWGPHRLP